MFLLPPPDPNERREPRALELSAPVVVFLAGRPSGGGDRIASAVVEWRPGVLVVAAQSAVTGP